MTRTHVSARDTDSKLSGRSVGRAAAVATAIIGIGVLPVLVTHLVVGPLPAYYPATHSSPAASTPAPTAAPVLPACLQEDGAGMALCTWDAQRQGNGQGHSVVSGDCARPEFAVAQATALCVRLHAQGGYEEEYEGAMVSVPPGPAIIDECLVEARSDPQPTYLAECMAEQLR